MFNTSRYNQRLLHKKAPQILELARNAKSVDEFKEKLTQYAFKKEYYAFDERHYYNGGTIIRVRDAARVLHRILLESSEKKADFSVAQAIIDVANHVSRSDLKPGFYAELLHLFLGLEGHGPGKQLADMHLTPVKLSGRQAAKKRSDQLDRLSGSMTEHMQQFHSGLDDDAVERREKRRDKILNYLNASVEDWNDWEWQIKNIMRDPVTIFNTTSVTKAESDAIEYAHEAQIPFAITPYYLSLMDDTLNSGRDRSIRAQVIPTKNYVDQISNADIKKSCLDFMREEDTSPEELITRRYPAICIFKPFNTCPQICVYCQRNWEIKDAMDPDALASDEQIAKAIEWIRNHPGIHEVLITGGDPLALDDEKLRKIIQEVANLSSVERIRIGSRIPVTMPMRITENLADLIVSFHIPGKRQVALVTHFQHGYEITPETVTAINRLRERGIPVYNQTVYTFFISRRFEAAHLKRLLKLSGIEPYYTFNTKGKEETKEYRVPLARLLQEQKEESRLLPGLARTDEAVFNVPGLGKNYLRARQHRDLISIMPDGSRLYEFHPWEKNITENVKTYIGKDVPILDYLKNLAEIGEDVQKYKTIWYYY